MGWFSFNPSLNARGFRYLLFILHFPKTVVPRLRPEVSCKKCFRGLIMAGPVLAELIPQKWYA